MTLMHRAAGSPQPTPCFRRHFPALQPEDIFYFPAGLPGFERIKGFSVHCPKDLYPCFSLRALTGEKLSFVCVDPFLVCPDYDPHIQLVDLAQLELTDLHEAIFVALLNRISGAQAVTVNLRAPIILNRRRRLARQVDCPRGDYPIDFPIYHALERCGAVQDNLLRADRENCQACAAHTARSSCAGDTADHEQLTGAHVCWS